METLIISVPDQLRNIFNEVTQPLLADNKAVMLVSADSYDLGQWSCIIKVDADILESYTSDLSNLSENKIEIING